MFNKATRAVLISFLLRGRCNRNMFFGKYEKNDLIINDIYRLIRKIGCGSFGVIYLGVNQKNGEVRENSLVSRWNVGSCR